MNNQINPEVILKAAQITEPGKDWFISPEGIMYQNDDTFDGYTTFDYMTWGFALERALKKEQWVFYQTPKGKYVAFDVHGKPESDESDTLLLLRCVSAQFSIPLYLEGDQALSTGQE